MADMKINSNTGTVDYYDGATAVYSMPTAAGANGNILTINSNAMSFSNTLPYVPATGSNWSSPPTQVAPALDELVARINVLETNLAAANTRIDALEGGGGE